MAVGDVSVALGSIAAGAAIQVQTITRSKVIGGCTGGTSYSVLALSEDNVTYYNIGHVGNANLGNGSTIGTDAGYLLLPAGYYIQIKNTDTVVHGYVLLCIEY